ncbi:TIGR00282 family metallophosphoesterase [candidate division KSB1 bacterium]|nr:TIGR00282 family metallophosphoesterase [candidate division KSB1 bacterium]
MKILFIADIVGKPGLEIVSKLTPTLREKYKIDFCIANGENGCEGKGLTKRIARDYFNLGIDLITSGNHIWDNRDIYELLNTNGRILRPLNYPNGNHGKGSTIVNLEGGPKIGVINLQGRTFMYNIDCPFRRGLSEVRRMQNLSDIIIVDFHAEATAEKVAMGWYLDGKVSAVIGTHTHVPTADERVLPEGTAYITDVGMTGPFDSVIGLKKELAIKRFLHQTPVRFKTAEENLRFCAVAISVDCESGKATSIERINLP